MYIENMEENLHKKICEYKKKIDKIYFQTNINSFVECSEIFYNKLSIDAIIMISMFTLLQTTKISLRIYKKDNLWDTCDICGLKYTKKPCIELCQECADLMSIQNGSLSVDKMSWLKFYHKFYTNDFCYENGMRKALKIIIHNKPLIFKTIKPIDSSCWKLGIDSSCWCELCLKSYRVCCLCGDIITTFYGIKMDLKLDEYGYDIKGDQYHLCQACYANLIKISDDDYVNVCLITKYFEKMFGVEESKEIFKMMCI